MGEWAGQDRVTFHPEEDTTRRFRPQHPRHVDRVRLSRSHLKGVAGYHGVGVFGPIEGVVAMRRHVGMTGDDGVGFPVTDPLLSDDPLARHRTP